MIRVIALFIGVILSLGASAATATSGGLTWTYTTVTVDKTTTVTLQANGTSPCINNVNVTELTIPAKLGGYPVTCLGKGAFTNCLKLTKVNLPASVTQITAAFAGCAKLATVSIAAGTTSLTMSESAFGGCSSFTAFENQSANFSTAGGLLYNAAGTKLLRCPTALTDVVIPDTVTDIGKNAFAYAAAGEVQLPSALVNISYSAFIYATAMTNLSIAADSPNFATKDGVLYTKDMKTLQLCPPARTELCIEEGTTNIADYAVYCANMKKIVCPNTLSYLSNNAFIGTTTKLTEVTFMGPVPTLQSSATLGNLPVANTLKIRYCSIYASGWAPLLSSLKYTNTEVIRPGLTIVIR